MVGLTLPASQHNIPCNWSLQAVDLPGHGDSRDLPIGPPYDAPAFADSVIELLRYGAACTLVGPSCVAEPRMQHCFLRCCTYRQLCKQPAREHVLLLKVRLLLSTTICPCRSELGADRAPDALLGHSMGGRTCLAILDKLAKQGAALPKQARCICSC
jgi:surfactin synthase thioesterase subunit